jgi:hypothetical protein
MEPKRELLAGNTFVSQRPELKVQIDDAIAYKGTFKIDKLSNSADGMTHANIEKEYHVWMDQDNMFGVLVLYKTLPNGGQYWHSTIFNEDDKGAIRVKKDGNWQTKVGTASPGPTADRKLYEMGLDFSKMKMVKIWAKNCTTKKQIYIIYAEKYKGSDTTTVDDFVARADESIRIIE